MLSFPSTNFRVFSSPPKKEPVATSSHSRLRLLSHPSVPLVPPPRMDLLHLYSVSSFHRRLGLFSVPSSPSPFAVFLTLPKLRCLSCYSLIKKSSYLVQATTLRSLGVLVFLSLSLLFCTDFWISLPIPWQILLGFWIYRSIWKTIYL